MRGFLLALVLVLLLVLPGVATWVAARDWVGEDDDTEARLLLAVLFPIAGWVLLAELLSRVHALSSIPVWTISGLVGAASVAYIVRARWRPALRISRDARRWVLWVLGAAALGLAAEPLLASIFTRSDTMVGPTSWYYWVLTKSIAAHHGIPRAAREWGTSVPFFKYHLGFNASGAMLVVASRSASSLLVAQLVRALSVVGTAFGAFLFARSWRASRVAALGAAVVVLSVTIYIIKLSSYRPECLSYTYLLLVAAAAQYAFRSHRRALFVATVVGFAALGQIHGLAGQVGACAVAATALVHLRPNRRAILTVLLLGVVLSASWVGADALFGRSSSNVLGSAPAVTRAGVDPTYEFFQLVIVGGTDTKTLGFHAPGGSELITRSFESGFRAHGKQLAYPFFGALAAVFLVLAVRRGVDGLRYLAFALIAMLLLGGTALVLSTGWHTYVPRRTGYMRLADVWWFLPVGGMAVGISAVGRRPGLRVLGTGLLAAWLVFAVSMSALSVHDKLENGKAIPSRAALATLKSAHLKPRSVVLTNAYEQGFVQSQTQALGLLNGRAPYLDKVLLTRANALMLATNRYFKDPLHQPFPFSRYHVRYVLVSAPKTLALGTPAVLPTDYAALDLDPRLKRVKHADGLTLYTVTSPQAPATPPAATSKEK